MKTYSLYREKGLYKAPILHCYNHFFTDTKGISRQGVSETPDGKTGGSVTLPRLTRTPIPSHRVCYGHIEYSADRLRSEVIYGVGLRLSY